MDRKFVVTGIVLILLSVVLGAFGAHALKTLLKDDMLQKLVSFEIGMYNQMYLELKDEMIQKLTSYETGIRYQMYSGFAFLIIGLNKDKFQFSLKPIFTLWILGTLFFSVSIYFLTIQSVLGVSLKFLGPITPLGGLLLISGWAILLLKFIKQTPTNIQHQTSNINNSQESPTQPNTQSPTPNS